MHEELLSLGVFVFSIQKKTRLIRSGYKSAESVEERTDFFYKNNRCIKEGFVMVCYVSCRQLSEIAFHMFPCRERETPATY